MKKQTFNIPEGCKIVTMEQIDNRIITTFEAEEKYIPKVGDCVKRRIASGYVYGVLNDKYDLDYCVVSPDNADYYIENSWACVSLAINTKITPEELQAEFNKLGYEYDFETNTAKKIKWKPKEGEEYYFVEDEGLIISAVWDESHTDISRLKINNCFKTEKDAKKFIDYLEKYNPDETANHRPISRQRNAPQTHTV